jgi:molybdate transport system regulatory protein
MKVKCRIYISENDKHLVGDGKIRLLEAVDRLGSVNLASKEFGLSYPHAWRYIHELEESFGENMVRTQIGGKGGGGAALTEFAKQLVEEYNKFRNPLDEVIERQFEENFKHFLTLAKQNKK